MLGIIKGDNRIEFCLEFFVGTIILECDSAMLERNFDNLCFGLFLQSLNSFIVC